MSYPRFLGPDPAPINGHNHPAPLPAAGAPPVPGDPEATAVASYDAAQFPALTIEDIPIGAGTIFATFFTGITNGPQGARWIFAKKACEQIPIDWTRQYRVLTSGNYTTSACVAKLAIHAPGDDRRREHVMLRADRVAFWLSRIDADRVEDDGAKARLRFFQEHAASAIDAWLNGRSRQPAPPPAGRPGGGRHDGAVAADVGRPRGPGRPARGRPPILRRGPQQSEAELVQANLVSDRAGAAEYRNARLRRSVRNSHHPSPVEGRATRSIAGLIGHVVDNHAGSRHGDPTFARRVRNRCPGPGHPSGRLRRDDRRPGGRGPRPAGPGRRGVRRRAEPRPEPSPPRSTGMCHPRRPGSRSASGTRMPG